MHISVAAAVNDIGDDGAIALAQAVKESTTFTSLDVSSECVEGRRQRRVAGAWRGVRATKGGGH